MWQWPPISWLVEKFPSFPSGRFANAFALCWLGYAQAIGRSFWQLGRRASSPRCGQAYRCHSRGFSQLSSPLPRPPPITATKFAPFWFWGSDCSRMNDLAACRSWSRKRGEAKKLELIGMTAAEEGSLWPTADSLRCAGGEGRQFRVLHQDVGQQGGRGRGEEGGGIT